MSGMVNHSKDLWLDSSGEAIATVLLTRCLVPADYFLKHSCSHPKTTSAGSSIKRNIPFAVGGSL